MTAHRTQRMRRIARVVLAVLAIVALAETIAAARAYRTTIRPEHWEATRAAIDARPATEPVWLATEWLGPRARLALPRLAGIHAAARPDLRGAPRFSVLGSGDAWSRELQADLEDLPAPQLVDQATFGPLVLSTWAQPAAGAMLDDLLGDTTRLQVFVDDVRCKGKGRWRCNLGRARPLTAEIDYRARRCIAIEGDDGVPVRIEWPQVTTGDALRGHVGFPDFNRRLRSDSVSELTVRIDGVAVARLLATDAEGWKAFAVATDPGTHDIALEVVAAARGTWGAGGYDPGAAHATCVELRTFAEARE